MSQCSCMTPPFSYKDFVSNAVGVDETHGRFGDVSLETCIHCNSTWIRYFVEYEAFSCSGRWYRGQISEMDAQRITAENAASFLEGLPWYFLGGSYFDSTGRKGCGPLSLGIY